MRKSKEDALFEKIVFEAAKVKSADLEKQAIELNKEPIPEEARARFMRELDKVYPEGGKKKQDKTPLRIPRRAIAIAIACVVLVIVLIPSTSEAVRRRINELIKKVMPQYTEYQLDEEILGFDGKTYVPTYIPEGFTKIESESSELEHVLSYRNDNDEYFDIIISSSSTVTQLNSEGAVVEPVFIGEESGELLTKGGWAGVIWSTEVNIFTVDGELSGEEIMKIARNLKENKKINSRCTFSSCIVLCIGRQYRRFYMKKTVVLILMFLLVLSSFSTVYADSNIKGWHSDSDAS